MFWAQDDALGTIREVKSFGVRAGQLGIGEQIALERFAESWDQALTSEHFTIVTAFCSYNGEAYTDIPTVMRTVGLVPAATRAERVARTKAVSDVARALGIDSVACHIGFLPEDRAQSLYGEMRDVARDICDHCANNGQRFVLETGQEPAKVLLRFMEDVGRPNLKINFDPANMILYGTGDPIEALDLLAPHVISVHAKDGDWPPINQPTALGVEKPLGDGSVNVAAFVEKLRSLGYRGILSIEREEPNREQRAADIRKAVELLRGLTQSARTRAVDSQA
jgi:sugar phosphate isomerase/epimerase